MRHDNQMPREWHMVKTTLLREITTAANFHLCVEAVKALLHARLHAKRCALEAERFRVSNDGADPLASEMPADIMDHELERHDERQEREDEA